MEVWFNSLSTWKSYHFLILFLLLPGTSPCSLTCLAQGFSFYHRFGDVTDGTLCQEDREDGVCIRGQCKVSE